jgi:P-type conjugative transfer protein TrbJ
MKKWLFVAFPLITCWGAQVAHAQYVVIDPKNLAQSTITAVHTVQTTKNQITQLAHEVQSLANEAQNLKSMPANVGAAVMTQYTTEFGKLVEAMQSINGIAQNVAILTAQYNATFPNSALARGPLSNANVMAQLTGWLNQSRSVYQGAYNTQAQVIASLSADSANLQNLLQTSGSTQGALSAIQTGNQLNGQIAAQLMKMNSQMASTNQAQLNWIAQQSQMMAQAQRTSQNAMAGYTNPSTATVNLTFDRLH